MLISRNLNLDFCRTPGCDFMGGKWLNPFDWKNLLNFTTIGVVVVHDKPSQIQ